MRTRLPIHRKTQLLSTIFNVNRQSYKQTMKQSDKEKTDSRAAMQNKDFRQAINFAFDRHAYAAQTKW